MALVRLGGPILSVFKPQIVTHCFGIPNPVSVQVRNAARKGYRDKLKKQKKLSKLEAVVTKESNKIRKKYTKVEKTVELQKPDPPNDDIIIMDNFKHIKYSISDAVKLHREFHHPTVFNNPEAPVTVRMEFSMIGKKITQILKPFTGIAAIPHPIVTRQNKEILVLCDPEFTESSLKSGASIAGGLEIVKKIQGGVIQPAVYDYIICHVNFLPQIAPIRGLLKNHLPKIKNGTLTANLKASIHKFLHGVEYTCVKFPSQEDFGIIECQIGSIKMELEQIEENFKALIEDVLLHKPSKERDFITWIWCLSPPSDEKFAINLSQYLPQEKGKDEEDDEEEELTSAQIEKIELRKLKQQLENETLLESKA